MADTKWSQFPSASDAYADDEVVGLKNGQNSRFSFAIILALIRQNLSGFFVPTSAKGVANGVASLDNTGKVPSAQLPPIASTAADVTYDNTGSGLMATDVQAAIDEIAQGGGGGTAASAVSYDNTGSGLAATNVQDAIDEVYGDIPTQPSDIGAQDEILASGILMGDGQGGVTAATAGTDYATPGMIPSVPSISTSNPNMDGTGAAGSTGQVSDAGHTHPSDTTKAGTEVLAKVLHDPAGQNVSVGEYAIYNGQLYTANTAITSSMAASTFTSYLTAVSGGGLNSVVQVETGNVTFDSGITGYTYAGISHLYRSGNVVKTSIYLYAASAIAGSDTLLCTVPAKFRPSGNRRIEAWLTYGGNSMVGTVNIDSTGKITTSSGSNTIIGFMRIFGDYMI